MNKYGTYLYNLLITEAHKDDFDKIYNPKNNFQVDGFNVWIFSLIITGNCFGLVHMYDDTGPTVRHQTNGQIGFFYVL